MLALAAAAAFYQALMQAPIAFFCGALASRDAKAGAMLFLTLTSVAGFLNLILLTFFWFAVLCGVLRMPVVAAVLIGALTIVGQQIFVGGLWLVIG